MKAYFTSYGDHRTVKMLLFRLWQKHWPKTPSTIHKLPSDVLNMSEMKYGIQVITKMILPHAERQMYLNTKPAGVMQKAIFWLHFYVPTASLHVFAISVLSCG